MPPASNATATWLSVLGDDSGGEDRLKYTWELAPVPNNKPTGGDIWFPAGDNGRHSASRILMAVTKAGTYIVRAKVTDEGDQSVYSGNVSVTFSSNVSNIRIAPQFAYVPKTTTDALTASVVDQFGRPVSPQPGILWAVVGPAGGVVDQSGVYLGGTVFGRESVTAVLADGTTAGSATRNIVDNATVVSRRVFYNNSAFDGNTSGAAAGNDGPNNDDDEALAPDTEPNPDPDPTVLNAKRALLAGQQATFANYTSFSKGLNGIMIDLAGLPQGRTLTASDFVFKVGNTATLSSWTAAPAPTFFTIRQGEGVASSDRVTLIWEDNAIQNQWLQVTIRTTANAGLASPDVFYFGNLIGDTGVNTSGPYATLAEDYSRTRAAVDPNPGADASILSLFDHNRDGRLTSADYLLIPPNYFKTLLLLNAPV